MLNELADHLVKLDRDKVYSIAQNALDAGEDPMKVIDVAQLGMEKVGEKFSSGEYFLAELMLSGKIFQTLFDKINPLLKQNGDDKKLGTILLATPQGDIHDLGKSIVNTTFTANGWNVIDLGIDVPIQTIIDKTAEIQPDILGLSCLLTTVFDNMKETEKALSSQGLRDKIKLVIGGGVTNESTKDYVGADFQCSDVILGLDYCNSMVGGER